MESPDEASEIACPMVLQAVVGVLQSSLLFPFTPLTYQVLLARAFGATTRNKPKSGRLTSCLLFINVPSFSPFINASLGFRVHRSQTQPTVTNRPFVPIAHYWLLFSANVFFALPFMTVARGVPLDNVADVKTNRNSRISSSHTMSAVTVRIRFPNWSNSPKRDVPVQSGFTVYVPETVV